MSAAVIPHARAYLLDVIQTAEGARVSLGPVVSASTATVQGYEVVSIDPGEVERLVAELRVVLGRVNLRGALDETASEEVRKLGHLLFDELLPPSVKDFLRERDGADLLVRTDEALADVPWELLHTGEGYLALRWNLGRLISVAGLTAPVPPRTLKPPFQVGVLADPCGDLDAAYAEGLRVRDVLDAQNFLRVTLKTSEVSRAYLRENIREFDILHFAGHGQVDGEGEGWLLSDGRFCAADIQRLQGGRPFPSLVFANACGSGRTGDGVMTQTLARQFIGAGVRHFIGTHWDVPDEIAAEFAERLYRGLCHGVSVGSALRQARLAMSLIYGHGTILWGSYCLYGDPHYVYFPDAADSEQDTEAHLELPILEAAPAARGIYHTLDIPVTELRGHGEPLALGPHPSMRREAVTAMPDTSPRVWLSGRQHSVLTALLAVALLGTVAWQAWPSHLAAPTQAPAPDLLTAPQTPSPAPSAGLAAVIREQEEAERKAPPKVSFDVVAQTRTTDDALAEIHVNEGTRLRSGDNVRVELKSDRDVYVALVLLDDHAAPQLLFPHPSVKRAGGNYLSAGEHVYLPGPALWYRLDDAVGTETLLVFAGKQPLTELDALVAAVGALPTSGTERPTRPSGMVIRGISGVTGEGATPHRRAGKKVEMMNRTRVLAEIQTLALQHDVDVVQAVTYVHGR